MPKLAFNIASGELQGLYEDGVDYRRVLTGGSLSIVRNSHINPRSDLAHAFQIDWAPQWHSVFGETTLTDAEGNPFFSKGSAEKYETQLLREQLGLQ